MKQSLEISIYIKAPLRAVWEALTDPSLIEQYFFGTKVKTDWKVGSPISFEGEYQGMHYKDKGVILKNNSENVLSYSYWSSFSGLPDKPEYYQIVTYLLREDASETFLTIKQENLKEVTEATREHWNVVLENLKSLIERSI